MLVGVSLVFVLASISACDSLYLRLYPTAELTITNLTSHEVVGVYLLADDSIGSYRETENLLDEATGSDGTLRITGIVRDIYTVVAELDNGLIIEFEEIDLISFDTYALEIT